MYLTHALARARVSLSNDDSRNHNSGNQAVEKSHGSEKRMVRKARLRKAHGCLTAAWPVADHLSVRVNFLFLARSVRGFVCTGKNCAGPPITQCAIQYARADVRAPT
jgi:hypothetical protein